MADRGQVNNKANSVSNIASRLHVFLSKNRNLRLEGIGRTGERG